MTYRSANNNRRVNLPLHHNARECVVNLDDEHGGWMARLILGRLINIGNRAAEREGEHEGRRG